MTVGCYQYQAVSRWNGDLFQSYTAVPCCVPKAATHEYFQNLRLCWRTFH